jgi:hypothetical protein
MEYVGQFTETKSHLTKGAEGKWTSKITYTQGRSEDGEKWEEKTTSSTAFSDDPAKALAEATFTMMEYLKSLEYSLFESGLSDVKDNSQ